jgi:hypothetical protein
MKRSERNNEIPTLSEEEKQNNLNPLGVVEK